MSPTLGHTNPKAGAHRRPSKNIPVDPQPPPNALGRSIGYIREYLNVRVGNEDNIANRARYEQQQKSSFTRAGSMNPRRVAAAELQQNLSLQAIQNVEHHRRQEQPPLHGRESCERYAETPKRTPTGRGTLCREYETKNPRVCQQPQRRGGNL